MVSQYTQQVFYHFVLSDPTLVTKWEPDFFDDKNLKICFKFAKDFYLKYKHAPSCTEMEHILSDHDMIDLVQDDVIKSIYSSQDRGGYSDEWLYDNCTTFATWRKLENSLKNTISYVKMNQDNVNENNVKEFTENAKNIFNHDAIITFEDVDDGVDFWDAASHKQNKLKRSSSGYEFIDTCLDGGFFPGSLICIVGAPKVGKSMWLQNLCAESVKRGEDNVYISLELQEELVNSRIGSNMFSIPSMSYRKFADNEEMMREKILSFKKGCLVPPGKLIVKFFPTSTMSVIDLEAYLLKREEEMSTENKKFKFKNVFVDYINIMRNYRNPNSENTYMKIKQLAEDLRAMGAKNGWAVITATQTGRQQFDTDDISSKDVAESVGLGATVDAMFGIVANPQMKAEGKYYLKCIYDRVAPFDNMRKLFHLDKEFLRITEDMDAKMEDCNEVALSIAAGFGASINAETQKGKRGYYGKKKDEPAQEKLPPPVMTPDTSAEPVIADINKSIGLEFETSTPLLSFDELNHNNGVLSPNENFDEIKRPSFDVSTIKVPVEPEPEIENEVIDTPAVTPPRVDLSTFCVNVAPDGSIIHKEDSDKSKIEEPRNNVGSVNVPPQQKPPSVAPINPPAINVPRPTVSGPVKAFNAAGPAITPPTINIPINPPG